MSNCDKIFAADMIKNPYFENNTKGKTGQRTLLEELHTQLRLYIANENEKLVILTSNQIISKINNNETLFAEYQFFSNNNALQGMVRWRLS